MWFLHLHKSLPRRPSATHLGKFVLACSIFLISLGPVFSQIPDSSKTTVDSLIAVSPKTFTEIHSVMGPVRTDTLLMRYFEKASAKRRYDQGQIYALNELGRTYRNTSQYTPAIALHEQALSIANKIDNLEFRVMSLNNLGVVYRRISSIRTAMDYNQQALELAETVKSPSRSLKRSINVSYNCIGNNYQMLRQYDEAIFYFEKSLILEAELDNSLGIAINHQNIGECQEAQGELEKALDNYRTSLKFNEEIGNNMGRVICWTSIAQIYLKQDRSEEAEKLLDETLPLSKKLGDGFLTAPVYINLGWAQMLQDKFAVSEANMLEGLKIAETRRLRDAVAKASHLLSDLYEETGSFKKALDYMKKAVQVDQDILNERTVRYVNDIILRYDSEKKSNEIQILAQENEMYEMEVQKSRTILLIGGIALALLAGIFYILYRQYQLKNEKKLLTLEQSMLRSQMNPHFLFNSLNSIKLYIINNEQKNAVHYLNKFSKLVRKILEASSVREIPLAEELETIDLYMNIENIRFSNEINFKVIVDEGIDTHTIRIPSLILQPFLENALWHGLSSKTGEKNISLHISKDTKGYIHISITDNGVGREAAEKLKKNKVLKRKSVGIEITKERLANFSKDYLNTFHVEIIDLYDKQDQPNGTKVILHIPTT